MDILSILLIALGLSADCFAVAISGSASMRNITRPQVLRTSLSFGAFQTLMPVIGWLAGRTVVDIIAGYDHWLAFALLALVGGRMLWEAARGEGDGKKVDISRGTVLIVLSIATSIDALAVGLSFAFWEVSIAVAGLLIGLVAFSITAFGFLAGRKLGRLVGKYARVVGGIVLIAIGLRILLSHLLG
ncbi:MAG: manganese efflux pump [Chloroflexi bacterium]|nr:manganese efflux pump [Chloroflexota bacterium]